MSTFTLENNANKNDAIFGPVHKQIISFPLNLVECTLRKLNYLGNKVLFITDLHRPHLFKLMQCK